jgi:hypothetical protein
MKVYKNFDEIDQDLEILQLQTHIDREKIKLSVEDMKSEFRPMNIVTGIAGQIARKALVMKSVAKLVGITKAKIVDK